MKLREPRICMEQIHEALAELKDDVTIILASNY
jgi:hypothetical protein